MDRVVWNYLLVKSQARKLEDQADILVRMADRKMQESMDRLAVNWRGENADRCVNKCAQTKTETERLAQELRRTANSLRNMAERVYQAEMRARELARTRRY